ncbi:hypothetical protein JCM10207_003638 [Rhodosporidiobolus poonsookiae]
MAYPNPPPIPTHASSSQASLGQSSFSHLALSTVLEDLCARFIVNLPAEELESMDRVCFQIEQAHWYYEDFIRPTASNPALLPSYGLKAFSLLMFKSCPLLHDLVPSHGKIWTSFMAYKERVPVCGAIMISEYWDKVLLVKGWNKGASWSFPRGKINKQEPEAMCAVREVLEETGFDLTDYFPPHQLHPSYAGEEEGVERIPYYVELVIREQKIRLYFVPNVPEATRFETRTRKEISKIDWFRLSSLPTWNQNQRGGKGNGSMRSKGEMANGKQAKFYMVTPFISHLKLWIDRNRPKNLPPRPSPATSTIPLSPEWDSPRPLNPTPHHAALNHHPLVPWDDATSHLPSETEHEHSDMGEATTSTEDEESEDERAQRGVARTQTWGTMQEGTDALRALFFGSSAVQQPPATVVSSPTNATSSTASLSLSQHTTPPAHPLPMAVQHRTSSTSLKQQLSDAAATPPHIAYERQQSFIQPRPQQSRSQQSQQARLLELLTGQGMSTPPPAASAIASSGPQPDGTGSLLGLLNDMHLSTASPLGLSHQQPSPSQAHASLLFGGPVPPAVFDPEPEPEPERSDEEKREKHSALLRALFSVAAQSPAQPPPAPLAHFDDLDELEQGQRVDFAPGQYLAAPGQGGTPRSDEIEALFHSGGSSASRAVEVGSAASIDGQQPLDSHAWSAPQAQTQPQRGAMALYSLPNEQLVAPTPLTSAGWQSISSSDEASDGSRRRRAQPAAAAAGQGKGSLLAILNNAGGAGAAVESSPSAYSQFSEADPAKAAARDPLEILREFRMRQQEQERAQQGGAGFAASASPPEAQHPLANSVSSSLSPPRPAQVLPVPALPSPQVASQVVPSVHQPSLPPFYSSPPQPAPAVQPFAVAPPAPLPLQPTYALPPQPHFSQAPQPLQPHFAQAPPPGPPHAYFPTGYPAQPLPTSLPPQSYPPHAHVAYSHFPPHTQPPFAAAHPFPPQAMQPPFPPGASAFPPSSLPPPVPSHASTFPPGAFPSAFPPAAAAAPPPPPAQAFPPQPFASAARPNAGAGALLGLLNAKG